MIWRSRLAFVAVLCGGLTVIGLAGTVQETAAQDPVTESRPKFDIAIGTWISTGYTRWAHNASSVAGFGNPTSQLTYEDVGANVIELTGTAWLTPRWFGRLNVGYAGIGGGRLTDNDYGSGQQLFSSTNSDLSGNSMWYLNADGGFRIAEYPNHRGWLDLFGGFQWWYTKYQATGVAQVACDPSAIPSFPPCDPAATISNQGQTVITNTTNWYSIRAGASTEYRLTRRLSVIGTAALIPLSIVDNDDIHHLRVSGPDALQQNPSISMVGWGVGADADAGLRLVLVKNLFVNVGYRVWWNYALDGNVTFHGVNSSSEYPLTQFQSIRQGLTASLSYTF